MLSSHQVGHRCTLWADVKELCGLGSFCSSGGAAVYSYTGKVSLIHSLRHIYFLTRCSRSKSSNSDCSCSLFHALLTIGTRKKC